MTPKAPLKINDVIYGVGGAFDKKLGKITKINPSMPAVEDSSGRKGCYWKTNMLRVGTVSSRFGYCSSCQRPSAVGEPCQHSGTGGNRCPGIVRGNYDWKLKNQAPERSVPAEDVKGKSVGMFLAKQLGEALFLLGFKEISDDIIAEVRFGLKRSATARRGLRLEPRSSSPLIPVSNSNVT